MIENCSNKKKKSFFFFLRGGVGVECDNCYVGVLKSRILNALKRAAVGRICENVSGHKHAAHQVSWVLLTRGYRSNNGCVWGGGGGRSRLNGVIESN